ncbi:translation initiation factor IF-2 subunit beta [Candidatus Bathyarchaeota archaeon]|nr:MAG: translation initiation factor IF-2 subunit beta [Candidatus Bathyarchaeota archaeon]
MEPLSNPAEYRALLERAYAQMPEGPVKRTERLEIPRPRITIAGSRTIYHNFKEFCDTVNRKPEFCLRFFSRELATAGFFDGTRAIFQGVFEEETIMRLIQIFLRDYVICPVCKRPDTHIVKEKRIMFLICDACGAKSPVRPL